MAEENATSFSFSIASSSCLHVILFLSGVVSRRLKGTGRLKVVSGGEVLCIQQTKEAKFTLSCVEAWKVEHISYTQHVHIYMDSMLLHSFHGWICVMVCVCVGGWLGVYVCTCVYLSVCVGIGVYMHVCKFVSVYMCVFVCVCLSAE